MTRTCRSCGKTIEPGSDLYYQIDLTFKDPFGRSIFIGDTHQSHAAFCLMPLCVKKAGELLNYLQGVFGSVSV